MDSEGDPPAPTDRVRIQSPTMPSARTADFPAAQRRHWSDAELLLDAGSLANADQLYGYCTECALKAAMITLGLSVDEKGHPEGKYRTHLPDLWTVFEVFLDSRDSGRRLPGLPERNPFEDWTVDARYSRGDHATPDSVRRHRTAARNVAKMIEPLTGVDAP